jgi:hypothetical protein
MTNLYGVLHGQMAKVEQRDCMKKPQVRANRLSMRRLMAAYTNASLIAHNFS